MNETANGGVKPNNSIKKCDYIMTTKEQARADIEAWTKLVQSAYGLGHAMGQTTMMRWLGLSYLTFIVIISLALIFHCLRIQVPFLGEINFLVMLGVGLLASHMVRKQEKKDETWEAKRMEQLKKDCFKIMKLEETEVKEEDAVHDN